MIETLKVRKGEGKEVMPDLTGLSMRSALEPIEGKGLIIKVSGNGKVIEQIPRPGTVIEKGDICFPQIPIVVLKRMPLYAGIGQPTDGS